MSLIDELKKQMGQILGTEGAAEAGVPAAPPALLDNVFGMIKSQGLGKIVEQFSRNGLGDVVSSWVGKGENLPINPAQLKEALGSESLQNLATRLGIPLDHATEILSKVLPGVVDKLTPEGAVDETTLVATETEVDTAEWQTPLGNSTN